MILINNGALMNARGFVTLENVVLIIVVALGLLAMQGYLRRSIQAHWRGNADTFYDDQYDAAGNSTETFANPINSQPAIKLSLNPDPSLSGSYDTNTHIGAFAIPSENVQQARATSVLVGGTASKPATILTVGQWQAPCVGEGCGEDDGT